MYGVVVKPQTVPLVKNRLPGCGWAGPRQGVNGARAAPLTGGDSTQVPPLDDCQGRPPPGRLRKSPSPTVLRSDTSRRSRWK